MNPDCHGEWLLWRAAEGLPYPEIGEVAEILAGEYAEEIADSETYILPEIKRITQST